MDSSLTFYLVLGALLLGFIVLGMLKGMIKMLLFGAAVLSSVAAYFWLSKYGFTYLSFITSDPREWMVTVLSVGGAAAVFFVFMHGLFWFSDVFSWGRRMGFRRGQGNRHDGTDGGSRMLGGSHVHLLLRIHGGNDPRPRTGPVPHGPQPHHFPTCHLFHQKSIMTTPT